MKNVTKMAKSSGADVAAEQLGEKEYRVLITVSEEAAQAAKAAKDSR